MTTAPIQTLTAPALAERFLTARATTLDLCAPLEVEDHVVQSMPDASPAKWHMAHVTWFFETFVLKAARPGYRSPDGRFERLFNSYYNSVGDPFPRGRRGLLTRPTVAEVLAYRRHVDGEMARLLANGDVAPETLAVAELGLHHEQQHQELILMDVKHALSCNPLHPVYREDAASPGGEAPPLRWRSGPEGVRAIGHEGEGFAFDNEAPRHRVYLEPFQLASRLVTCGEFLHFLEEGGYDDPTLWLADGWSQVRSEGWRAPLYWLRRDSEWWEFTLGGLQPLDLDAPVCHVSYYEAEAYARWAEGRLPTEAEWEVAAEAAPIQGNFLESGRLHPATAPAAGNGLAQLFGDVWEWTASAYAPYPGYRPPAGALGEYNGKFMCNQYVLRGGACVTPAGHVRATYRNFFYPHQRWMFAGFRLALDAE